MKLTTNFYQIIVAFLDNFGGDLSHYFRNRLYNFAGVKIGKGVKIDRFVSINQPYNLTLEEGSVIGVGAS